MTAQGVSVSGDRRRPDHRDSNWLADWFTALRRVLRLEPKPAGKPGHRKGGKS